VALASEFEDDAVVNESIYGGACGHRIGKDLSPIGEREVGCNTDTAALLSVRYYLKKQVRRLTFKWNIAQFVDRQEVTPFKGGEPLL
jgi:hypothetical protein